MAQVIWANAAINDLQSIREYFEAISAALAERQIDQIIHRTRQLAHSPQVGRIVPEFGSPLLREVLVGKFRIVYRLSSPEKVEIARIYHSSQELLSL